MSTIFGFPLLPLWIMGAPLLGALLSLALPAPKGNTMPRLRRNDDYRDDHLASTARPGVGHTAA